MLPPLALTPCSPTSLISYSLRQNQPTTLLICLPRQTFLSSLLKGVSNPTPQHTPAEAPTSSQAALPANAKSNPIRHPLLIPTLQQISSSKHINIVFIPTVSHLRAYLSVFSPANSGEEMHGSGVNPLLVAYGLLELHRKTSEWSVQGLGHSLAALVEAGARTGNMVQVVEARREEEEEEEGVWHDGENYDVDAGEGGRGGYRYRGSRGHTLSRDNIWYEKLPILNGSLRRAGANLEYAGRTVDVGVVLKRWFKFQKGSWEEIQSA